MRETRRILGRYYLTHEDLKAGRRFDDGICHVTFAPDIHHCDPSEGRGLFHEPYKPYDIPYRCLLARDIDNLMLAGRCISGDHVALATLPASPAVVPWPWRKRPAWQPQWPCAPA